MQIWFEEARPPSIETCPSNYSNIREKGKFRSRWSINRSLCRPTNIRKLRKIYRPISSARRAENVIRLAFNTKIKQISKIFYILLLAGMFPIKCALKIKDYCFWHYTNCACLQVNFLQFSQLNRRITKSVNVFYIIILTLWFWKFDSFFFFFLIYRYFISVFSKRLINFLVISDLIVYL